MAGPTVNGSASICQWELEFYFLDKNQVRDFIKLLMKEEVDYNFEYEKTLDDARERHYVTVRGCWANNLVHVAKLAEKVDYKDGN
jgi:hypothetical protein